ncbi:MAG: cation:proton antiporter [Tannerella sp.]|nr:cation:proton antiporter [Tannerella sp.]
MKQEKKNSLVFYTLMILVSGMWMWFIIRKGEDLQTAGQTVVLTPVPQNLNDGFHFFVGLMTEHIRTPFGLLLLQVITILFTCRVVGWIFNKLRQPSVIGEIMAGILLGPSILGDFMPEVSGFLFPVESLSNINILSQFGLILFMYSIGMELDLGEVKKKFRTSLLISHTSMMIPFALGVLVAYFIYDRYAYAETSFLSFALFIGIAMSITAFPVLARIIQEKKLTRTHLGTLTLASAANGDLTAWCILACVIAVTQAGSMLSSVYIILFAVVYMAVMFLIVRPLLRMIGDLYHNREVVAKSLTMLMFLILLVSSYLTEILGLHALFGAFIVGIVMPENARFRELMSEKVEDVSLALFLPLFFASTGLRTEIGLLNTPEMWQLCGVFILAAIVGKFGGTLVAARFARESWKNSLLLGGLMNTRGLMELVVLTIGYEMHILPPAIFVILILMTLVTTFMTMPLLSFIGFCFRASERITQVRRDRKKENVFRVLLSFGRASNGQVMLDVAHQMFSRRKDRLHLTAFHLTVGSDVNPLHTDNFERVSFGPILYEAKKLNMRIETRYEVSSNAGQSIVAIVNEEPYDFLLVGAGISMSNLSNDVEARTIYSSFFRFLGIFKRFAPPQLFSPGSLIQDKTKWFIERTRCSVGVFVNRGFIQATRIILIVQSTEDLFLLDYAKSLVKSTKGMVSVLNRSSFISSGYEKIHAALTGFVAHTAESLILPEKDLMNESFNGQDFMLISYATWNLLTVECEEALKDMPSTLIIHHRDRR